MRDRVLVNFGSSIDISIDRVLQYSTQILVNQLYLCDEIV
jgi:hypothetical protein